MYYEGKFKLEGIQKTGFTLTSFYSKTHAEIKSIASRILVK